MPALNARAVLWGLIVCLGMASATAVAQEPVGAAIRVEPLQAAPGDVVRILGDGFGPRSGRSFVTIGGVKAPVMLWEEGKVVVWVPGDARSGLLTVTVDGRVVAEAPFTVEGVPIGEGEGRQRGLKIWKAAKRLFGVPDKKPAPPPAPSGRPAPSALLQQVPSTPVPPMNVFPSGSGVAGMTPMILPQDPMPLSWSEIKGGGLKKVISAIRFLSKLSKYEQITDQELRKLLQQKAGLEFGVNMAVDALIDLYVEQKEKDGAFQQGGFLDFLGGAKDKYVLKQLLLTMKNAALLNVKGQLLDTVFNVADSWRDTVQALKQLPPRESLSAEEQKTLTVLGIDLYDLKRFVTAETPAPSSPAPHVQAPPSASAPPPSPPVQATLPPSGVSGPPEIVAISHAKVTIGTGGFTLTVTGRNFDQTAKILWAFAGQTPSTPAITPIVVNSTTLTVQVTQSAGGFAFPSGSSDFTPSPGSLVLQVVTYDQWRERRSNTVSFTIVNPSPVISSITGACRADLNCTPANGFPVRITGSGFVNNLVNGSQPSTYAEINGRPTPVTLVGQRPVTGEMQLLVNGSLIPTPGTYSVKVCNVGTAQGTSCSTGSLMVSGGSVAGAIPAASRPPAQVPTRVLSPVRGRFHIDTSGQNLFPRNEWSFWQHKSGPHGVGGGIGRADDANAWDMNLATEGSADADKGQPVFAVAKGTVALTYAGCAHAGGGSLGAVLVDHGGWWTGYLHMDRDSIRVRPGQPVDDTTPLGIISNQGVPDGKNHLHFVVYTGNNLPGCLSNPTAGGLKSVDVELIPR